MKFPEVLVCAGLALLATIQAGVVPPKAGLSHKDKLALELPVKQHHTDKTIGKQSPVKVGFSTTTTTTTTTTPTPPKPQRPQYVDATVFRHQFTTPPPVSTTPSSIFSDDVTRTHDEGFVADAFREIGLVTDRKTESFRVPFIPASSGSVVLRVPGSTATFTRTTTTSSPPTDPPKDAESHDYEAHFRIMDDPSPFGGELGILGGDRRGAGYIGSFRPLGF